MAIGKGTKLVLSQQDASGYLSDESDFYGDEATIGNLEYRAAAFNPDEWWANKRPSLTEIADAGISARQKKAIASLYNPYQGDRYRTCARQLEETVEEFLARLPPATTRVSSRTPYIPWIFIANPFIKASTGKREQNDESRFKEEGPELNDRQLEQFEILGRKLLEECAGIRLAVERKKSGEGKAAITKAINIEKERVVQNLLETATMLNCTSGKWMTFCPAGEVNAVWTVVARATAGGDLGIAAKVAPDDGQRGVRLICIYTKDFNDIEDVTRVLQKMKDIGLFQSKDTVYYKCDAYTYLGLNSKNEYDIKASLYNSKDILAGKIKNNRQKKPEGLLHKKKEENEDWRELEQW